MMQRLDPADMLTASDRALWTQRVAELVAIPSPSSRHGGCEGAVQRVVAQAMREAGARVRCFEPADVPEFFTHPLCRGPDRQYNDRPTVLAELGPADGPTLMIIAHSDTVSTWNDPALWTYGPFNPVQRDGYLWGRGAGDDKWGVAGLIALAQHFAQQESLPKRLIFASTIDEENGIGNGLLLLLLAGLRPDAALYLDGCDESLLIGNLGGASLHVRPGPEVSEAALAGCVARIEAMAKRLSAARESLFDGDPLLRNNPRRDRTLECRLDRGEAGAELIISFVTLPGETRASFCPWFEAEVDAALGPLAKAPRTYLEPWFEPTRMDPQDPLVRLVADAYEAQTGRPALVTTVAKQDTFIFRGAGIPTVSIGAGRTKAPGAQHVADEFLELDAGWRVVSTGCRAITRWLET